MYACLKGNRTFTTSVEILAYLGLNIVTGIKLDELPQLVMYLNSDEFIGVEGFKKLFPKHCFMTLGQYYILLTQPQKTDIILSAKVTCFKVARSRSLLKHTILGKTFQLMKVLQKLKGFFSSCNKCQ